MDAKTSGAVGVIINLRTYGIYRRFSSVLGIPVMLWSLKHLLKRPIATIQI